MKKTFFTLSAFFAKKKIIILASVLKKRSKKLGLILTTSILVTVAKKKIGKNSKNGKNSKYLEINLIEVLCIQYPIISKKNLCWHYLTPKVRSMLYTQLLLKI